MKLEKYNINIIGAGLAGSEIAWYLASKGIKVNLYEMRPKVNTEVHVGSNFSELVCSNSLKSTLITDASGLLKKEMENIGSLILEAAYNNTIPGGTSLIVDREGFSNYITNKIKSCSNINVINEEVTSLNEEDINIIATGPLTSSKFSFFLKENYFNEELYFYDAVAPIISIDNIDFNIAYYKSRYDKGEASYINCPMNKEEYEIFYNELINAKTVKLHDFEKVFESCMPIETLAKRGSDAIRFGPLKPIGLDHDGKKFYAVVQLRQDDFNKKLYNIVGFQTNMLFSEQKRILKYIPGLNNVDIVRYGVIHRNTYINSPKYLSNFSLINKPNIYFVGQITGVEGYLESASSALLCATYIYQRLCGIKNIITLSNDTMIGSLAKYLGVNNSNFVPMNANYSIIDEIDEKKKEKRRLLYYNRSMEKIGEYVKYINGLSK